MILDSSRVVSDALKAYFGIDIYIDIICKVQKDDFKADAEFRKTFNGYYKVRQRSEEWYDKYYSLMEAQKNNKKSFGVILDEMKNAFNNVEVSFVSKLIASVDPNLPIWDQYVLKNLGFEEQWVKVKDSNNVDEKKEEAIKIYGQICKWYREFLLSEDGKKCIAVFDDMFPDYKDKVSDVKKVDFWLWGKR